MKSLEINKGQMGSSNASGVIICCQSDAKMNGRLFGKDWESMEMLTQVKFCYEMAAPARLQLPVDGVPLT